MNAEPMWPDKPWAARQATRDYPKRQLTWFRNRMADWTWIEDGKLLAPAI